VKGVSEDTALGELVAGAADWVSFKASSSRSESLSPRRLSGSIISAGSSGLAFRDPAGAEPSEDGGVAPTGTLPSTGASTGRSVSGSKTGRDAASIVSSLVNAFVERNRPPRKRLRFVREALCASTTRVRPFQRTLRANGQPTRSRQQIDQAPWQLPGRVRRVRCD
jgi:hypothetical protein